MQKFEVWTIAGGEHTNKPRPCMIVQADAIEAFDTVVIIPITSFDLPNSKYRLPVQSTPGSGLLNDSFLELEKISAVKKQFLGKNIGRIPKDSFIAIDNSVARLLGIEL
jgi:mRNA interferase MazF